MALKEFYVEHPAALDDASKLILEDLQLALAEGVPVTLGQRKVRLRFCVTGIKGDLPFLIETGHLERHFRRAPRRGESNMRCPGICHYCLAGATLPGRENNYIPYEDFGDNPVFESTMQSCAAACPWYSLPPLLGLPGFSTRRPLLWRTDLFHNFHLGHGRYFLASALVCLQQHQVGSGVDARFQVLTQLWLAWCRARRVSWLRQR